MSQVFKPAPPKVILLTTQKFVWAFLALLFAGLRTWVVFSDLFRIQTILCRHGDRPCSDSVEAELLTLKGKSILTFRPDSLEQTLKNTDISVNQVTVHPRLPHTLEVSLSARGSTVALAQSSESASLLVDEYLTPFKLENNPQTKPQIVSPRVVNLFLGEQIVDPILLSAIRLFHTLNDFFVSFKFIQAFDDRLQLVLKDNTLVLFPLTDNFVPSVTSLQLILQGATIDPKPSQIDLQFSKPVLRF